MFKHAGHLVIGLNISRHTGTTDLMCGPHHLDARSKEHVSLSRFPQDSCHIYSDLLQSAPWLHTVCLPLLLALTSVATAFWTLACTHPSACTNIMQIRMALISSDIQSLPGLDRFPSTTRGPQSRNWLPLCFISST